MASDIDFDLGFEISNLYYTGNHVHVALTTLVASEVMATSRQPQWPQISILTSDLKQATSIILGTMCMMFNSHFCGL